MIRHLRVIAPAVGLLMATTAFGQTMTDVGTPRNETLIVQTFDGKTANPDAMNPFNLYAIWRGFRELGWSYLWEMDTATGESYPELAAAPVEVLNDDYTKFRITLREGVYWSDGVELTVDDFIYTLETAKKYKGTFNFTSAYVDYVKSWEKIDDYTFEVETTNTAYDVETTLGVYTWGAQFTPAPKHIFEPLGDAVTSFNNAPAVTLGPYKIAEYDPNGFWQLWELRDDWERSGWGNLGTPGPKYVLYKDFGAEDTRALAFVQNQYDIDTFMSPDTIEAAKRRNEYIQTFSDTFPYHDMNDACSYGVYINQQKAPYDLPEVRWALALSLDLEAVGLSAVNGQFKAAALPLADTPITGPLFFEPLEGFLEDLTIGDGYKPFDPDFGNKLVSALEAAGTPSEELPTGDAVQEGFGDGWWKHDPEQAEKLLNSVGIKKGSDGFYMLPDGSPWQVELVFPADWNKVLQRVGFAIADSWQKAGFNVNARQVDAGEHDTTERVNARFELEVQWNETCTYNANWLMNWRDMKAENVFPVDSNDPLNGNYMRVTDEEIFDLVADSAEVPLDDPQLLENGREIMRKLTEDMQVINLMNIPTTIPTNSYYWTNYPKQDNFYAAPYSWWSSFKKTIVNIEPTGRE